MTTTLLPLNEDLLYPSGDGKPMSENTKQYRWIVLIKENLEILFAAIQDVFIAADLLWYPVQVKKTPAPSQAPDVMVVFGRPKGDRRSYKQWQENNLPPQVVFEILSDSNKTRKGRAELQRKFNFYQQYGVEEYYIYDPDDLTLEGWQQQQQQLVPISPLSNWVSPQLKIRFDWSPGQALRLYHPDGRPFLSPLELEQRLQQAQVQVEQAQAQAEQAQAQVEQAQGQAEQAERLLAEERQQVEQARQISISRLLGMGLNTEQIAEALGISVEIVEAANQPPN